MSGKKSCPGCGKVEKSDGIDGDWWHKLCFKCNEPKCRKQLEPGNYSDHGGHLFCKRCYATQVKLQGYGYGNSLDSYRDNGGTGGGVGEVTPQ